MRQFSTIYRLLEFAEKISLYSLQIKSKILTVSQRKGHTSQYLAFPGEAALQTCILHSQIRTT